MFKILIVEDNVTFRQSLKSVLRSEFPLCLIEEARDGNEALLKIASFRPNVVFMDIKLPGENGLELTKRIKATHSGITIIILTSYDLPEYRQAAEDFGADYFVSKGSSTREEILALVRSEWSENGVSKPETDTD